MNAERVFLGEILKLKRWFLIAAILRILLWAFLIFMFTCLIGLLLVKAGFSNYGKYGSVFVLSGGIILLISFLFAFLKRSNFLNFLIDIDYRLKLQERITTAYEYQSSKNTSGFSDLLMQDAADKLHLLSYKQIFPPKFSVLHLMMILIVTTNAVLYSGIYLIPGVQPGYIENARTLLQDVNRNRIEGIQTNKAGRSSGYHKKLEQLTQMFNDRSVSEDRLFESLNRYLKETQAEQTRIANELDVRLNSARIEEMPIQNNPKLENYTSGQLEKLKGFLKKVLNNQIPDPINKNIEILQELQSMEKLLSQIIDEFSQENTDKKKYADSSGDETRTSQYTNGDTKDYDGEKRPRTPGKFSSRRRDGKDSAGHQGSMQSNKYDPDHNNGIESDRGYSDSPGNAKASGEKMPRHEIEKSTGSGFEDKMISSQAYNYLVRVRSLTTIGESNLKEEHVLRTYQQEIESIINKEDIPLNYREYIKQYFLSIGLKAGNNANDFK